MQQAMHFSDVLASSVHDIKNSLSMVIHRLDNLLNDPQTTIGDPQQANLLQLEVKRANGNLIQLLALYKLENRQLEPAMVEHNVEDLLDEIVAENSARMEAMGLVLETDCDPFLSGYFDEGLVRGVLDSTIGNAERYTSDRIGLSAGPEDGYLVFRIEDNGPGYSAEMLEAQGGTNATDAFDPARTQLGLFFARKVAALHRNAGRAGFVRLVNGHTLSGGCFELWLP